MENFDLAEDIKIFCVTAKTFPEGIMEAFQRLEKMLPGIEGRMFFGISFQNKDCSITYKAGVKEAFTGEAEKYGCEPFIIQKGMYLMKTISDWKTNIPSIGNAFLTLLAHPQADKTHPCVEWYKSYKELICLVRKQPADPVGFGDHRESFRSGTNNNN